MKQMKFVTKSLLALALFSFALVPSPIKTFATENIPEAVQEEAEEEVQVILPDSLSEKDEKAINAMISTYQRSRNASPEQLEAKISNYFEAQYGTTRSIYIVEFKSQGNGSVSGRLIYVLMGNDALKRLNEASGGFEIPGTSPKTGYAFDNWSYVDDVRVESKDLKDHEIYGSSIFYAKFEPDTNGDGIPDIKQRQFKIQFISEANNGTLGAGQRLDFVAFEVVEGAGCYISNVIGFQLPYPSASSGYAFDYWKTSIGEAVDHFNSYKVYGDLKIWPVFAVDSNYDGTPDHRQTIYGVDFIAASGGQIFGNSHFIVSAWENGQEQPVGWLRQIYPKLESTVQIARPDVGYMLEYWIDQKGEIFYPWYDNTLWERYWSYEVKSDTVFVAVFTEDINHDNIPDYKQTFLSLDFVATSGGRLEGDTHFMIPGFEEPGAIGYIGYIYQAFPYLNMDSFAIIPESGYTFDYWIDHRGNQYYEASLSFLHPATHAASIEGDTAFVAVFAEDLNGNGIPDYRDIDN